MTETETQLKRNPYSRQGLNYGDIISLVRTMEITPTEWEIYKEKYKKILSEVDAIKVEEYFSFLNAPDSIKVMNNE